MYILSDQRTDSEKTREGFRRYREYVHSNKAHFPSGAYDLAASEWYFDPNDTRCPHDACLDELSVTEPSTGDRGEQRVVAVRIRLLDAYHRGFIDLAYGKVFRYEFTLDEGVRGHRDWRYDEFRLTANGHLLHEIEWWGPRSTGRWVIEADDVHHAWSERRD